MPHGYGASEGTGRDEQVGHFRLKALEQWHRGATSLGL